MMVEIRRIRADEGPVLMQVRLLSLLDAPYAFGSTYFDSVQRPTGHWAERASSGATGGNSAIYLAHAPDGVVGIAGSFRDDEVGTCQIYGVWVERGMRGQGLAGRLVETVLEWAAASGAERAALWVAESNAPAVALYERLGFEDTGIRRPLPSNPAEIEKKLIRRTGRSRSA